MHGGAIGFASQAGVGSTFAFYIKSRKSTVSPRQGKANTVTMDLNVRSQVSAPPGQLLHNGQEHPPEKSVTKEILATDLHILIVEDNLVNQRVLAKQLRNLGMKVAVANHGGEALEYLNTTNYCAADGTSANELSLVLMDWEMPV
jgi:PleD family two-component response regulator